MKTGFSTVVIFIFLITSTLYAQTIRLSNSYINVTQNGHVVTTGSVLIGNGAGIYNNGNIRLGGNWVNNAQGLINSLPGLVEFNGQGSQDIGGPVSTEFAFLKINNPAGVTLGNNQMVAATLIFDAGKITTGVNDVNIISNPPVAIVGANTNRYVNGNLAVQFGAAASGYKFEIGNSVYAPATLTMQGSNSAGTIRAYTNPGDGPNENNPFANASAIDPFAKVHQYWVFDNNGVTLTPFDLEFDFTNTFNTGSPANYMVRLFDNISWITPVSVVGGNLMEATGVSDLGEFVIGEQAFTSVNDNPNSNTASVFPIPARDKLFVQLNAFHGEKLEMAVFDFTGRMIYNDRFGPLNFNQVMTINTKQFSRGMYILKLFNGRDFYQSLKFTVENN